MKMNKKTQQKHTILIVDDDPNILHMLEMFLGKREFQILTAQNGREALERMEMERPDLIICDIMMPEMDGYELRRKILGDDRFRFIPFIFLSAKGKPIDVVKGMEMKVDDYITKPFDYAVFLARVSAILQRYQELNKLIHYDALTGLYNRRAIEDYLKQELERVKRYRRQMSLLMLDLDFFKNINDTYGHDFGDRVLVAIANVLRTNIRELDFAGRFGGEEFLVIMPETDIKESAFVAERLREAVELMHFEKSDLKVTISGGLATAPKDGMTGDALLKKADMALYMAKEKGRNRIEQA